MRLSTPLVEQPCCSGRNQVHIITLPCQQQIAFIRPAKYINRVERTVLCSANGNGKSNGVEHSKNPKNADFTSDKPRVWTKFVAETLLPTTQGKFRVRGYRHTVSLISEMKMKLDQTNSHSSYPNSPQIDGGTSFTEPSAIISGNVEGQEAVSFQ